MTQEVAMLQVMEGPSPGRLLPLEQPELIVGRDVECDLVIPERQVSRRHARIVVEKSQCVLEDLGSKNGTFVNGRELTARHVLADGDQIQIALCCRLAFVAPGATVPLSHEEPRWGIRLDQEKKQVWVAGRQLQPPLSLAQYRLIELLYQEPGRVYSRDEIVRAVWPEDDREGISQEAIDALTRRLRERLAELDSQTQYVVTVRGHGFRLDNAAK